MARIKDIAEQAGVSTATVSLALNGSTTRRRVSSRVRDKIRRIASELNYRPSSAARMMGTRKTMQVGVLLRNAPDIPKRNLANFETILGIGDYLTENNYTQLMVPLTELPKKLGQSSRVFSEHMIDGIIVLDSLESRVYSFIKRQFQHAVFVDTNYWSKSNCLRRDDKKAGTLAAQALLDAGYERILYIEPGRVRASHFSLLERYSGIVETLDSRVDLLTAEVDAFDHIPSLVAESSPPVGIIGYDSQITRYVFGRLSKHGLLPPEDYGLISCDDSHETELTFPWLSRVDNNRYEMGQLAAKMLIDSIEQRETPIVSQLFDVNLIPGQTTSC